MTEYGGSGEIAAEMALEEISGDVPGWYRGGKSRLNEMLPDYFQ